MSQDSNTILQGQLKQQGLHTTRPQYTNILYGTVVQTDVSIAPLLPEGASSPIPTGMMTVAVAALGSNYVTTPILYPGGSTPTPGDSVAVGFTPNGTPICVTTYGSDAGVLPIEDGGTGASTASEALISLGAVSVTSYNVAGKNVIINGGMDIWQRGGGIPLPAATNTYTADRWCGTSSISSTTEAFTGSTGGPTGIPGFLRISRTSGVSTQPTMYISQSIETLNSNILAGQTVTISFYSRAGSNYSPTADALAVDLITGTGTDQNVFSGYTGQNIVLGTTATLTTSWQRFIYTVTLPTNTTEIGFQLSATTVGTAGANDYFDITGVQLELGAVATPFSRAGGDIQGELAKCQRYYYENNSSYSPSTYNPYGTGACISTINAQIFIRFPVTMRISPTMSQSGTSSQFCVASSNGSAIALSSAIYFPVYSLDGVIVNMTVAGGLVAGNATVMVSNDNNSSWLAFSAEL